VFSVNEDVNFVYCSGGSQASERFSNATSINTTHVTPSCMIQKARFTISSLRPRIHYTLRETFPEAPCSINIVLKKKRSYVGV
jgi:hypothetical protein